MHQEAYIGTNPRRYAPHRSATTYARMKKLQIQLNNYTLAENTNLRLIRKNGALLGGFGRPRVQPGD
jgi:hypothetical protein